jgi:hypothetical protein
VLVSFFKLEREEREEREGRGDEGDFFFFFFERQRRVFFFFLPSRKPSFTFVSFSFSRSLPVEKKTDRARASRGRHTHLRSHRE